MGKKKAKPKKRRYYSGQSGVQNKSKPHWEQERRYRGRLGYGRIYGDTSRSKALKSAKNERAKGYYAHVKKERTNDGRELYYVWSTRVKGGKRKRR